MRPIVALLVLTLALPAAPLAAAGTDLPAAKRPLTAAITRAADQAALAAASTSGPQPLPRPSNGRRVYKQSNGGSSAMVVLGIVGALAGVAGTVYMVKQMKKTTDNSTTAAGFAR